jgi:hypothetical protein
MGERGLVMQFIFSSALAGLVGAACMALFMTGLTRMRVVNADMIRAIGSLFSGSKEAALPVGGLVHAVSGVVFAMIYAKILGLFSVHGFWYTTAMSGLIGFLHGFVVFFLLINMVAEHHPLPEFREVGVGVAAAHLVGHIIYGLVVGMILGGMNWVSVVAPQSVS